VILCPLQKATYRILEKVNNMCTIHENTNFNQNHTLGKACDIDNNMFNKNLDCTFYQTIKLGNTNYLYNIHTTRRIPKIII